MCVEVPQVVSITGLALLLAGSLRVLEGEECFLLPEGKARWRGSLSLLHRVEESRKVVPCPER